MNLCKKFRFWCGFILVGMEFRQLTLASKLQKPVVLSFTHFILYI